MFVPPQTIISLPVQTAVCPVRPAGVTGVGVHESVFGLYRPPLSWLSAGVATPWELTVPPQTIISLPFHNPVCPTRPLGAALVAVGVQLSEAGAYRPPVFVGPAAARPPQTIISAPVQIAVGRLRLPGALAVETVIQESVVGL